MLDRVVHDRCVDVHVWKGARAQGQGARRMQLEVGEALFGRACSRLNLSTGRGHAMQPAA